MMAVERVTTKVKNFPHRIRISGALLTSKMYQLLKSDLCTGYYNFGQGPMLFKDGNWYWSYHYRGEPSHMGTMIGFTDPDTAHLFRCHFPKR